MTAKEQLRRIVSLDSRIAQRLKLVEYYMEKASSMSQALRDIVIQGNGATSPMEECVVKAIDIARDINAEITMLRDERLAIAAQVNAMRSERFKEILERRYFNPARPSWQTIAEEMHLDEDHVKHLHGWALEAFERENSARNSTK
jgi:hypothetical protein